MTTQETPGLRKALLSLRRKDMPDGPCWCSVEPNATFPDHERKCLAVRAALSGSPQDRVCAHEYVGHGFCGQPRSWHDGATGHSFTEPSDPACPDCERTHPWRDHSDPAIEEALSGSPQEPGTPDECPCGHDESDHVHYCSRESKDGSCPCAAEYVRVGETPPGPLDAAKGCGFWLGDPNAEWYGCGIPDAEHDGRGHVLVRGSASPSEPPASSCWKAWGGEL